ncbi:M15 family metallopeptidase [Streptococcus downei]|uniref:D-alanyl-D-alanine-carboxypeptidase n=1 Tax=Streptococcus downei MFe28 TaxID=764290 RepID=A0A380JBU6_STRDO|nr:M15 family metallopeptidase [Streptococcus downei]SUN35548.1 D-alanyl-D-alanine-carboxypeptidase [Streptococcus downei MFe28]
MNKRTKQFLTIFFAVLILIFGFAYFHDKKASQEAKESAGQTTKSKQLARADANSSSDAASSSSDSGLPDVSKDDWQLILVNRDNVTKELNPDLTTVDNIKVDARIADNVKEFLAAAQKIDSSEHLISGYRSVAYQKELFDSYVKQEMSNDPSLTEEQAQEKVKTYSQPAGASEHQTGLAIDMSTIDSLNESDPNVVEQIKEIAPDYGFVLRFEKDKSESTGVDYEDWHFRYVGKASAKYMTQHNLSLEEYVAQLKK